MCVENLFSTLILGSVLNDYVVFYRDISLILLWVGWSSLGHCCHLAIFSGGRSIHCLQLL